MLRPIKTKHDHDRALERIYNLMQKPIEPNSKEADELEVLSILVEVYEKEKYALPTLNPIAAIKFRMEQTGMSVAELNKILGGRSRKSEIFTGKRKLSINMIRILHKQLQIPAESLISEY